MQPPTQPPSAIDPKTQFIIGINRESKEDVSLPLKSFKRHFAALGSSGSGKTVMCKVIIEEAARSRIPSIIVDPQGDIASLGLAGDPQIMEKRGTDPSLLDEYMNEVSVRIFTPASSKGIPISVQPLKFPDRDLPPEDVIHSLDFMAETLIKFLGYDEGADQGKAAKSLLYKIFDLYFHRSENFDDFSSLAEVVEDPPAEILDELGDIVTEKERKVLARKLRYLTVGANSLIFNYGVPLTVETFLEHDPSGKIPVNILYLNTLTSEDDKLFFIAMLALELYTWMLKNPSDVVQLLFYIDEIAPYLPPHPYTPPPKTMLKMIFKQARKYGVSCIAATQNPTDIDYKALAQVSTWALGRMMTKQDIDRVRHILRSISPEHVDSIANTLPKLKAGQFLLLAPDVYGGVIQLQTRWLFTNHKTLDEDVLTDAINPEVLEYFQEKVKEQTQLQARRMTKSPRVILLDVLEGQPQAYTPSDLAEITGRTVEETRRLLERLVKQAKARVEKVDEEYFYWSSEYELKPSEGVVQAFRVAPLKIPQRRARNMAQKHLAGPLGLIGLGKKKSTEKLELIPHWEVEVEMIRETGFLGLGGKAVRVKLYVNALSGDFLVYRDTTLTPPHLTFLKRNNKDVVKARLLKERIVFEDKMPSELVTDYIYPKLSKEDVLRIIEQTLAIKPIDGRLALIPIWRVDLDISKGKSKTIYVDGSLGFPIDPPYKE